MAINWFEGGRRISNLAMAIVVVVGAAVVFWRDTPSPVLTTRGPTMPWFVSNEACPENAYVRYLWDYDWGGEKPGVRLCYLPVQDGTIPFRIAPTPPEEQKKIDAERAENEKRISRGEPPTLVLEQPWFYSAPEYNSAVQDYVGQSIRDLKVTPELAAQIKESQSGVWWRETKKVFGETVQWVAGICIFLWSFTFAIGWIVRGFAGVPSGKDFRDSK